MYVKQKIQKKRAKRPIPTYLRLTYLYTDYPSHIVSYKLTGVYIFILKYGLAGGKYDDSLRKTQI